MSNSMCVTLLAGIVLVMGGVGGIEHSESASMLIASTLTAVVGLCLVYAAAHELQS